MTHHLHLGDCREYLATLPAESVDSVVTDPPYELGFMGKAWDNSGIAYDATVWAECLRVLKPGGHLIAFAGSRTYHRLGVAIEDAGFEIRDQILWMYGSGFGKGKNVGKEVAKIQCRDVGNSDLVDWNSQLKPAHEPAVLARKPLRGTIANNVLAYGTGALNVGACRVETTEDTSRMGGANPGMWAGKKQKVSGGGEGRYPANLIHDGSPEVLDIFPQTTSKADPANRKASTKRKSEFSFGEDYTPPSYEDHGSAARYFYTAKASQADRNTGLKRNDTCTHPTVKPTDLMRYLCRLVTPPGGTVLDPFTGSGSTGRAAMLEGFNFLGAELLPEYHAIAIQRIAAAAQIGHQKTLC